MDASWPLAGAARHAFRLGSRLRSARSLQPRGTVLLGELHVVGEGPLPTGTRSCVIRLSKALGTRDHRPDILGVGFRYQDRGRPVDVLVASSLGTRGWRRLVLWPATGWAGARFTSLLPWQSRDGIRVHLILEVRELAAGLPAVLRLRVATGREHLQSGRLIVTGPEAPTLDLDPVLHSPPDWWFFPGWVARVRVAA